MEISKYNLMRTPGLVINQKIVSYGKVCTKEEIIELIQKYLNMKISFFEKYLTIFVLICMAIGIIVGTYLPVVPSFLNQFEIAAVNIPIGILIWIMIYPMMLKIDFTSIKNVGKKA